MKARGRALPLILLLIGGLAFARSGRAAEPPGGRYALIIGNSAYGTDVVSGVQDAVAMADHLRQIGFENPELVLNRKRQEILDDLTAFGKRISQASMVVVFYSGHGFQLNGTNYLLPISGTFSPNGAVPLAKISDTLALAPETAVKLVFLDACRDLKNLAPGLVTGLAEMPDPPKQVLYSFAAGAGRNALSGKPTELSPYTEALLSVIREPGLEIRDLLARVHFDVALRTGGQQSPTEFGLSRLPEKFFLRDPVRVGAKVDEADNALVVLLNGEIALQKSGDLDPDQKELTLRAGNNDLVLLLFNEKSFHNFQSWERAEGWSYQFQLFPAGGRPLPCSERTVDERCFAAREKVPFKAGPHHGRLFQVARVNLHVDPATAELTLRDRDTTVWERETPVWARNQAVLYERKLLDMPLDDILGAGNAALVRFALALIAPNPDRIFVTVRGNKLAEQAVQPCMADEQARIRDLKVSIEAAVVHHPRPFDSFDLELTRCVQREAAKSPNPDFPPDQMIVWTAVEDRNRDAESAPVLAATALSPGMLRASLPLVAEAESLLLPGLAEQFSPVRPAQHQLAAVTAAQEQLQRLSGPLLYASLSAADLQSHLPDNLETQFDVLGIPGAARVARIELRDQEAVVWAAFELSRPEAKVRVAGEAEVHCAVAVERGALVLRPSVSTVHLTGASVDGNDLDLELVQPLVTAMLKGFLGNVSRAIQIQRIPLRLDGIERLDLAPVLDGVGSVANINAKPVDINVGLGAAALLVDAAGIHVLADAVVLTPERFTATVEELREDLESDRTPGFSSEQLAVLGECGQPLSLPEPLSLTFAAVCAAHARLIQAEAPTPAGTPEEAEAALGPALEILRGDFRDKVDEIEPVAEIPWDRTVIAVSRAQLVAGLNEILPGVVVQATVRPPGIRAEIPPENRTLRTPPAPDLHCNQVGGACLSVFEYPPYNPRGCDSNCGVLDFRCHGRKIECESVKEAERLAYETAKATAHGGFIAEKARCEAVKAGEQAGCRINQDWLNRVANLDVGELRGGLELREVDLPLTLDQVRLGADFDTIDLRLSAVGGGEISGDLTVIPHNAGHLVCVSQWDAGLKARVSLPEQRRDLRLRRTGESFTGDDLLLIYELSETPLQLKVDPPPVKAFLEQNAGKLALSCPIPVAIAGGIGSFPGSGLALGLSLRNEILRDTFDVLVPAREFPITIPGQEIRFSEGQSIRIVPSWGEKAILFEAL